MDRNHIAVGHRAWKTAVFDTLWLLAMTIHSRVGRTEIASAPCGSKAGLRPILPPEFVERSLIKTEIYDNDFELTGSGARGLFARADEDAAARRRLKQEGISYLHGL
jgi:hypothetical protein